MPHLTAAPLDLGRLVSRVVSPELGGVATFTGVVRNHHDGRSVLRLEYSAYDAMAEAECDRIVTEAERQWSVHVAVEHRTGRLEVGDAAVMIAVAGAHRQEAFDACRYVIEEVKRRVPIWKREHFEDGTASWVDPTAHAHAADPVPSDRRPVT
jgi:molybdopterin synthase catalytic subunit